MTSSKGYHPALVRTSWLGIPLLVIVIVSITLTLFPVTFSWKDMGFVFVGLLILIFTLAVFIRYPIAPYLIFPLSTLELIFITIAGVNIRPHQVIALVAIFTSLLQMRALAPKSFVTWVGLSYLAVNGISIFYSYSSWESLEFWFLLVVQFATVYALFVFLNTPNRVRRFLPYFLFSGFAITTVGFVQILLVMVGVFPPYRNAWMIPTGRPPGTFVESAWLAAFSLYFLIVFLPYIYHREFRRYRLFFIVAWFLMFVVNIFCMARAAWLGLILGIIVQIGLMLWLNPKGAKGLFVLLLTRIAPLILLVGLLAILIAPNYFGSVIGRFLDIADRSESAATLREDDFNDIWALIEERPLFGYGIGTLEVNMKDNPQYNPRYRQFVNVSLNMYLTMLYDAGVLSLITGFLFTVAGSVEILRNARRVSSLFDRDLLISMAVGLAAVVLTFCFSNGFPRGWFWVLIGVSLITSRVLVKESLLYESIDD